MSYFTDVFVTHRMCNRYKVIVDYGSTKQYSTYL